MAMVTVRRVVSFLIAPLVAGVPGAVLEFASHGRVPTSAADFLLVLVFVSRFGFVAAVIGGIPAFLLLKHYSRLTFLSVALLGAALGACVAIWVSLAVAPVQAGWSLIYIVLPGAVAGAVFWWLGGWPSNPSLKRTNGLRPFAA
jgi:hypothetical protein